MQYGMFCMHPRGSVLEQTLLSVSLLTPMHVKTYHAVCATVCLSSKHAGDNKQLKLNINLEKCAFLRFVLYNYATIHGVKRKSERSRATHLFTNVLFVKIYTETG